MDQTDRQTDKDALKKLRQLKGTWWLVTAYGANIDKLENPKTYPPGVEAVHGGREECPTTKRIHFQGAIQCFKQQRGAVVNDWLPGTHFEKAKAAEAIRKYCMKTATSVGEKTVRNNPNKYFTADEICMLIGSKVTDDDVMESADPKIWYRRCVNRLLRDNIKLAGQLMNPSLRSFWCDTALVWIDKAKEPQDIPDVLEPTNEIVEEGEP